MTFYNRFDLENPTIVYTMFHHVAAAHYFIQSIEQKPELSVDDVAMTTFHFLHSIGFYPAIVNGDKVIAWNIAKRADDAIVAVPVFKDGKARKGLHFPLCGPDHGFEKIAMLTDEIEKAVDDMLPKAVVTISEHRINAEEYVWHVSIRESFMQESGRADPVISGTACNKSYDIALMQATIRLLHAIFMNHYMGLVLDVVLEDQKPDESPATCILRRTKQAAAAIKLREAIKANAAKAPVSDEDLLRALADKSKAEAEMGRKGGSNERKPRLNVGSALLAAGYGKPVSQVPQGFVYDEAKGDFVKAQKEFFSHDGTKLYAAAAGQQSDLYAAVAEKVEAANDKQAFIDYCRKQMESPVWKGAMSIVAMIAKVDREMARHMISDVFSETRKTCVKDMGNTPENHIMLTEMFDAVKKNDPVMRDLFGIKD